MNILERYESAAQNYVREKPIVFDRARGAELFDEIGARYIDFSSGGGTLSYGHNGPKTCKALVEYLCNDGVTQTRDKASVAKRKFVEQFVQKILAPRGLDYKLMFTDPAGGFAAELALRLARREKKRSTIVAFTNGSHGLTEGALAATSKQLARHESLNLRSNTVFMPYCGYLGVDVDTIPYLRKHLADSASGIERPAAVIVESVQYDGGVRIASASWLKALEQLCHEFDMLLILDDAKTGCGRTAPFFAFESAEIKPDIVLVSSAIAGGHPISILLMRPELDQWRPGEQTGSFQGNNFSYVCATELLALWDDKVLAENIRAQEKTIAQRLNVIAARFPERPVQIRGVGMLWAMDFEQRASAAVVSSWALEHGLVVEPAGINDQVLVVAPPVTINESILHEGLERLDQAVSMFLNHK